ncbi:hypothetical protein [Lentzea atacamensis]|uniref:hypothetical protein n=1 Tax=Lentzea atacamensis TaxID=531938 RepID=UPI0011BE4014|nr:hypothetical protein [Lentzea atacamensis]
MKFLLPHSGPWEHVCLNNRIAIVHQACRLPSPENALATIAMPMTPITAATPPTAGSTLAARVRRGTATAVRHAANLWKRVSAAAAWWSIRFDSNDGAFTDDVARARAGHRQPGTHRGSRPARAGEALAGLRDGRRPAARGGSPATSTSLIGWADGFPTVTVIVTSPPSSTRSFDQGAVMVSPGVDHLDLHRGAGFHLLAELVGGGDGRRERAGFVARLRCAVHGGGGAGVELALHGVAAVSCCARVRSNNGVSPVFVTVVENLTFCPGRAVIGCVAVVARNAG